MSVIRDLLKCLINCISFYTRYKICSKATLKYYSAHLYQNTKMRIWQIAKKIIRFHFAILHQITIYVSLQKALMMNNDVNKDMCRLIHSEFIIWGIYWNSTKLWLTWRTQWLHMISFETSKLHLIVFSHILYMSEFPCIYLPHKSKLC